MTSIETPLKAMSKKAPRVCERDLPCFEMNHPADRIEQENAVHTWDQVPHHTASSSFPASSSRTRNRCSLSSMIVRYQFHGPARTQFPRPLEQFEVSSNRPSPNEAATDEAVRMGVQRQGKTRLKLFEQPPCSSDPPLASSSSLKTTAAGKEDSES